MNKLDLIAKVLNADLKDLELSDEIRKGLIADALRSFATDMLNIHQFFISKNVEENTMKEIMDQHGLDFSLKTKKFF